MAISDTNGKKIRMFLIKKYWFFIMAVFCFSCEFPDIPPSVSESSPEFSLEENAVRIGNIISQEDKQTLVILSPVTGISVKDGKIKLNQDIVVKNENIIISSKNNIYGENGLIIDSKKLGNANLKYAGYEVRTEIIPPEHISGTISVTASIKDINNNKLIRFVRIFRKTTLSRASEDTCNSKDDKACEKEIIKTFENNSNTYQAGVEKVTTEHEIDQNILGKWILATPSFSWQADAKKINVSSFKTQAADDSFLGGLVPDVGFGLPTQDAQPQLKDISLGFLDISFNKTYVWTKGENIVKGTLEEVIPRTYADAKLTYWKLTFGRDSFYIFSRNGNVYIYNAETHLYSIEPRR